MEPQLRNLFASVSTSAAAFAIHVTTYGILQATFHVWQTVTTLVNYGLAVYGLASEVTATHLGDETRQWGAAVIGEEPQGKIRLKSLLIWSIALVSSEVFMASLVAHVSLPCAVLFFMPAFCVRFMQGREAWKDFTGLHHAWAIVAEPLSVMSMHHCSVFGLKLKSLVTGTVYGPMPAKYVVLALAARLLLFVVVMLWQIDIVLRDVGNPVIDLCTGCLGIKSPLFARAVVAAMGIASLPVHCLVVLCLSRNKSWWEGSLHEGRHSKIGTFFVDWRQRRTDLLAEFDEAQF